MDVVSQRTAYVTSKHVCPVSAPIRPIRVGLDGV
jgi:hypothetical protein